MTSRTLEKTYRRTDFDIIDVMQNMLADQLWILVSAALVFTMQAGFLCVEVGSIADLFGKLK